MQVTAKTITNSILQLELNFLSYLKGPVTSNLCRMQKNVDPKEVLEEYLPYDYETITEEKLKEVLEEACLYAGGFDIVDEVPSFIRPVAIKIEEKDLAQFKQLFFKNHGMHLVKTDQPIPA